MSLNLKPAVAQRLLVSIILLAGSSIALHAADNAVQVKLDLTKAGPRTVESLTEQGILRDYRLAWTSMAQALEVNSFDPLDGPFTGPALQQLKDAVAGQQRSGLSQRYASQRHELKAVFYAPEGDLMELHDTAEFQLQILDGGKTIHEEQVVLHFIVLMTPTADRWVIRQMQAVPSF